MQLAKYDAARHALQIAVEIDDVKDIRDKAEAMAAYARQAKDTAMVQWATEIKVRAERKAGEILVAMDLKPGAKPISTTMLPIEEKPQTLDEMGITKNESSRWQKLARIDDEKFEEAVSAAKEVAGEVTTAFMLKVEKTGNVHVSNNSGENEWYTPTVYIEKARLVMGGIDTDPASSDIANKTVQATTYYTKEDDGLMQTWSGNVWMNPPYAQPLMGQFAEEIATKYEDGEISQACILVNNATETVWFQRLLSCADAVCFPKSRIKFLDPQGNATGAPLQGQAIIYYGGNVEAFKHEFLTEGVVLIHG